MPRCAILVFCENMLGTFKVFKQHVVTFIVQFQLIIKIFFTLSTFERLSPGTKHKFKEKALGQEGVSLNLVETTANSVHLQLPTGIELGESCCQSVAYLNAILLRTLHLRTAMSLTL